MRWIIAVLLKFEFKCSYAIATKDREVIPMRHTSALCKQENSYTTLDIQTVGTKKKLAEVGPSGGPMVRPSICLENLYIVANKNSMCGNKH